MIAGGLGLGIILYRRFNAPAPSSSSSACEQLCNATGLTGDQLAACKAACGVLGGLAQVVSAINPLHNSVEDYENAAKSRRATNDQLNGAVDIGNLAPYSTWAGNSILLGGANGGPVRYRNGCTPYAGSPGWSKCASGTLDMYASALDAASGGNKDYTDANAAIVATFESAEARDAAIQTHGGLPTIKPIKEAFLTGATGDPTTMGPADELDSMGNPTGRLLWTVRGKNFAGDKGLVPRAIAMQVRGPVAAGQTEATLRAQIAALSDQQAAELIQVGSLSQGSGTGTQTKIDCSNAIAQGLTWKNGAWVRAAAGEAQVLAPNCQTVTAQTGSHTNIDVLKNLFGG